MNISRLKMDQGAKQFPSTQFKPGQHGMAVHDRPAPAQPEAASAVVGATIEVTKGRAIAAAIPNLLINSRREICSTLIGLAKCFSNSCDFSSCDRANHTNCSETGVFISFVSSLAIFATLVRSSQCRQTNAAVRFRQ